MLVRKATKQSVGLFPESGCDWIEVPRSEANNYPEIGTKYRVRKQYVDNTVISSSSHMPPRLSVYAVQPPSNLCWLHDLRAWPDRRATSAFRRLLINAFFGVEKFSSPFACLHRALALPFLQLYIKLLKWILSIIQDAHIGSSLRSCSFTGVATAAVHKRAKQWRLEANTSGKHIGRIEDVEVPISPSGNNRWCYAIDALRRES